MKSRRWYVEWNEFAGRYQNLRYFANQEEAERFAADHLDAIVGWEQEI